MSGTSENNKRIAKNTSLLYVRMLLLVVVTLYASRVVLNALGVEDFGIYNVVAGFVAMLAFFTSSLSNATQRYLSLGLGRKDFSATTMAFRQSFTLMLLICLFIIVLGETVGLWFVSKKLVIPPERLSAAIWVYQFALISVISSIIQVTFMANIIARERMGFYAYLGVFEAVARLATAYLLLVMPNDLLVLYGGLTALISVGVLMYYVCYCCKYFPECSTKLYWNKKLVKEMSGFISCNLFGCFAWSAGVQGTNILLNMFFGPTLNAARGIATQISSVVARFTENIMTAVKPPIIKSYSVGDIVYMTMLLERSSKYAFFFAALVAFPLMFETKFVLQLWLGQVPDYTLSFTRLVLCEQLIGVLVPPLAIVANATGKIKNNQIYGRLFTLSALPIAYFLLQYMKIPELPMIILVGAQLGYFTFCLWDTHQQIRLNINHYIRRVIIPIVIICCMLSFIGCTIVYLIPEDSWDRFMILTITLFFSGCIAIVGLLGRSERKILIDFLNKKIGKK